MSNHFEPRYPDRDEGQMFFTVHEEYPTIPISSWNDGKVYPRPEVKRSRFFRIMLPLIPLLLLILGSLAIAYFYPPLTRFLTGVRTTDITDVAPTHTFSVGMHPDIIINDQSGAVSVLPGKSNQVVVNVDSCSCGSSERHWHWLPDYMPSTHVPVRYQQTGNELIVTAADGSGSSNADGSVATSLPAKLTVFVPAVSDVQVQTGSQDAQISGISGQFTLNSIDGDLLASEIQGPVTAHSEDGDIALRNVALSGRTSLGTGHGDIFVGGTLDGNGTYQFNTDYGDVNLALAASTSFVLQANASSVENEFGSSQVGPAPYAQVNVQAPNGGFFLKRDW